MKRLTVYFLLIGCQFTLTHCDNNLELVTDSTLVEYWDYSKITFIARSSKTVNDASWYLFIADKDGNNIRQIVEMSTTCSHPITSKSGLNIVFTTLKKDLSKELYVVNTDGSGLTLIDNANVICGNADWSYDDKNIVYVKSDDPYLNNTEIINYKIEDNSHTILQNTGNSTCPKFSPDGKKIAYCKSEGSEWGIYTMNNDGSNNQLIINKGSNPIWSPSGDKIAFTSIGVDRSSQISTANSDGSNQKQLTSTVSSGWWDSGFPRDGNEYPRWTLDGKKIIYVSWENAKPEIFSMNGDGSNKKRLTVAEKRDEYPFLTPDGNSILFTSRRSDSADSGISIIELNGKNQKEIIKQGIYPAACR